MPKGSPRAESSKAAWERKRQGLPPLYKAPRQRSRAKHPAYLNLQPCGTTTHPCLHCGKPMTYVLQRNPRKYHQGTCDTLVNRIKQKENEKWQR